MALFVETGDALPTLAQIKDRLEIPADDTTDDAWLTELLAAAVEVVEDEVRDEFVPLSSYAGPAMRVALIEFVRDMWASGGPRGTSNEGDGDPIYSLGRPLLPPYVRGLLAPYMPVASAPVHSFPDAPSWSGDSWPES